MSLACPTHRELVARVLDERATDDEIEQYAAEVPDCAACQAALSRGLGVHPAVLRDGGVTEAADGRARVLARLEPPAPWLIALRRALTSEVSARSRAAVWAAVSLAAAAIVAFALRSVEDPVPVDVSVVVTAPKLPELPSARAAPRDLPPTEVVPTETPTEARPTETPTETRPTAVQARPTPPDDDAVADAILAEAADWPAPPYVDLRGGAPKSAALADAVRLQLDGDAIVGGSVGLVVTTGAPTEVSVCVEGPERGVVWRGAVPSGRTVLTRDGRAQRFAFDRAGTWRFTLSTTDLEACAGPVHEVTVEAR